MENEFGQAANGCCLTKLCQISLFRFEMAESRGAVVADVPEAADLGRVGTGCHIEIGDVGSINRDAGGIPGIDVSAERAGLPAERA
jgi:hypothetical protein